MLMRDGNAILVVEPEPANARHIRRLLRQMSYEAPLATTAPTALDAVRREVFPRAIVAVELVLGSQPLLTYLSRLPAMELLMATGPPGAAGWESRARRAGAHLYLPRPVEATLLATALARPLRNQAFARPP